MSSQKKKKKPIPLNPVNENTAPPSSGRITAQPGIFISCPVMLIHLSESESFIKNSQHVSGRKHHQQGGSGGGCSQSVSERAAPD